MISRMTIQTAIVLVGSLAPTMTAEGDDKALGLADLEAYRFALKASPDRSAPAVSFRDLWDRPSDFAGRVVSVEGRLVRSFRQPKFGEFPPLVEAWIVSPAGDPFCLVFAEPEDRAAPGIGASVRFSGTFLKRMEYRGGDVARVAPLIVGPEPPSDRDASPSTGAERWSPIDWLMAAGAALVVALILAGRHLNRPAEAPQIHEPPPIFLDGKPGPGGDFDDDDR